MSNPLIPPETKPSIGQGYFGPDIEMSLVGMDFESARSELLLAWEFPVPRVG